MTKDTQIWYEPHPVTAERKAELRAQGFRILDAAFQPEGHENPVVRPVISREVLDAALAELPGNHADPDYVVRGMRNHFGDLFTSEDEAKVRELVRAPAGKPSEGLKAEEIKAALIAKGIEFKGNASKADLQALLDGAQAV